MLASLRSRAFLALTVITLAACGEETALPTDLSTAEATEDIEITQAQFETPQTTALVDLGTSIDDALFAAGGGATLASVVAAGPAVTTVPSRTLVERFEEASTSPMSALPATTLGKTFEWDVVDDRYEMTARTGAPQDGVRFILYTINPLTAEPAEPLVEVGSVTITQGGTESSPSATLTVRNTAGTSVFSYTAVRSGTASVPAFNISGNAGTGPNAATFSLSVGVNLISQNITADWRTTIPARSLTTRTTLGINPNTGAVTLRGIMQRGLRRVELSGTFNSTFGGQLTVEVGNKLFARIVMDGEGGVAITNPEGQPLTPEEEATLELIFDWFEASLTWYSALLDPVYVALGVDQ
ncbi:MAG: hypothetical protein C0503_01805 [Gemmatimonas sp.]|nr:hypothetical protein [Gemmatimonas sp.]